MKHPTIRIEMLDRVTTQTRTYASGEVIFRAGDAASELYVIKRGSVVVRIDDRDIEELGPTQAFGEMAILERRERSATAVATSDCEVVPISEKQLLGLIRLDPDFALALLRTLAQRLRTANMALRDR